MTVIRDAGAYAWIVVGAIGCGRIGFGVVGAGDAGDDDGALGDGAADAPLGAFSTPAVIPGLSLPGATDEDPELSQDLLELYFVSDRPGGLGQSDIYRTTRASVGAAWAAPTVATDLSSPQSETQPSLCCGGLVMYFGSSRPPAQGYDVFRTSRTTLTSPWSTPALVVSLSSPSYDAGGTATSDELEIIFDSFRGGSVREIYRSTRATSGAGWGTPQRIAELLPSMTLNEVETSLAHDNLLVFSSARLVANYFDVWTASRASRTSPFETPQNLSDINSTEEDRDPWLSADGRTIAFSRTIGGETDIYMATR